MKAKLNNYNLVKGSLVQMQRKKTWVLHTTMQWSSFVDFFFIRGNLSVRSLVDVVTKEHIIQDSDYLETCFVAVPKLDTPLCHRPLLAHGNWSLVP